jgi:hypothetical protein
MKSLFTAGVVGIVMVVIGAGCDGSGQAASQGSPRRPPLDQLPMGPERPGDGDMKARRE